MPGLSSNFRSTMNPGDSNPEREALQVMCAQCTQSGAEGRSMADGVPMHGAQNIQDWPVQPNS